MRINHKGRKNHKNIRKTNGGFMERIKSVHYISTPCGSVPTPPQTDAYPRFPTGIPTRKRPDRAKQLRSVAGCPSCIPHPPRFFVLRLNAACVRMIKTAAKSRLTRPAFNSPQYNTFYMRILVTGSAGFIGMHLAKRLLAEGHEVTGLDNFNSYYEVALKEARNAELEKQGGFKLVRADIADAEAFDAVFAAGRFDAVCHLAAQAGVRYSLENPAAYIKSNIDGFANALEGCRRHGVPRLVYASSSSVYGGNKKLPFSEDDKVDNPVSLYAATKKADELMAHAYSHLFGFQTIGLRFFTVYGPWGRPDMAMWLFAEAMLAGKPIKVFNHGDMERDFTYIDDIVEGVTRCVFAGNFEKCEVFNIGNHRSEKLMRLISVIGESLGVEPKLEMLPMQPGDVPATFADISKLNAKTGFEPTTAIEAGIPRFVEWFKKWKAR